MRVTASATVVCGGLADAESWRAIGIDDPHLVRALRTFNAWAPEFKEASETYAG